MRTLAITNQKGGVGKTTTCLNLGAALRTRGRKVLLIDSDPQESLTLSLGVPTPQPGKSLSDLLLGTARLADVMVPAQGMHLVPAGSDLGEAEVDLTADPTASGLLALKKALALVSEEFDFTIIDCPPSLGVLTISAMAASNAVLIPTQTEYLALRRLGATLRAVFKVRRRLNPFLEVAGILPTLFDPRTQHAAKVLEQIKQTLGQEYPVFKPVPRSIHFAEAAQVGKPIFELNRDIEGAKAYAQLAAKLDRDDASPPPISSSLFN
ncbi:MAG TPA: ParA family protein [Acidobacteriota bacterium]